MVTTHTTDPHHGDANGGRFMIAMKEEDEINILRERRRESGRKTKQDNAGETASRQPPAKQQTFITNETIT